MNEEYIIKNARWMFWFFMIPVIVSMFVGIYFAIDFHNDYPWMPLVGGYVAPIGGIAGMCASHTFLQYDVSRSLITYYPSMSLMILVVDTMLSTALVTAIVQGVFVGFKMFVKAGWMGFGWILVIPAAIGIIAWPFKFVKAINILANNKNTNKKLYQSISY
jgi:hypothetical protein